MDKLKKTLVQFGAGNIGRAFIGQLFSRLDYEVVFIDVDMTLVEELNKQRKYSVIVKSSDKPDEVINIRNVRAVHASSRQEIIDEIREASFISTSVGKNAVTKIIPVISEGIAGRFSYHPDKPIDIIIAENIRNGAAVLKSEMVKCLPDDFPINSYIGLLETSIGKSVPTIPADEAKEDPLKAFAEPYNQLILSAANLKNRLPDSPDIMAVDNITAYVDRKLYIHNLGHAAAAYFGYVFSPETSALSEVMENKTVFNKTRDSMLEAAAALKSEYTDDFTYSDLIGHIDDLLYRFKNKKLGDTVFRVGRDLQRKLATNDRLFGAAELCRKHKLPCDNILAAIAAGFNFKAADENGRMFTSDEDFHKRIEEKGLRAVLTEMLCVNNSQEPDEMVISAIIENYNIFRRL